MHELIRAKKGLGQVFLVNESIATAEAVHSYDKTVLEIGSGPGILTKALCMHAEKVIAIEKDALMCTLLKHNVKSDRLRLIHKDFFDVSDSELELDSVDILISNVPYKLSSKIIEWLWEKRLQAVLCLQKEFVEHMLAKPDTDNYSRLSVMSSLMFKLTKIMNVPRGNFRPVPRVDSVIIYLKPKDVKISERLVFLISLLMQHKKKTVYNAIIDSSSYLNIDKKKLGSVCIGISHKTDRVFKLSPETLLEIATEMDLLLK